MTRLLLELYRHRIPAALRLLRLCRGLPPEWSEETAPGAHGGIRATLHYLVFNEHVRRVSPGGPAVQAAPPAAASLDAPAERARIEGTWARCSPAWWLGIELPRLDLWAYGEEAGLVKAPPGP